LLFTIKYEKVMKISIAIPTYNSSSFIADCLDSVRKINFVNEIIINDDHSSSDEYSNLKNIVKKYESRYNLNILINQNKSNLGGFKNKYISIQECSNEFVYQIDSDNLVGKNLNSILNKNKDAFNDEIFYLPSTVYVFKKNPYISSYLKKYKVKISNKDLILNKNIVSQSMKDNTQLFIDVKNRWLFNLGNFIVNRDMFLKSMSIPFKSDNLPLAADPMAMSYFWLKKGGNIKLIKGFYHFHRLRQDSYWNSAGDAAVNSVSYFESKLKELIND